MQAEEKVYRKLKTFQGFREFTKENKMRFHRGNDPWGRSSYSLPEFSVVGASDTGEASDSPAPTFRVLAELEDFRKVLRKHHIRSRIQFTQSGNCCMIKRWVVVHSRDFQRALKLAVPYLERVNSETHWIHDGFDQIELKKVA